MKDIVIVGAGGFGRGVAGLIEDINKINEEWNILGFVDDNPQLQGTELDGHKVLGDIDWLQGLEVNVAVAVGDPILKRKIIVKLKESKNHFPVLIHPSVNYPESVQFGKGSIVYAGSNLDVNVEIGNYVFVNLNCSLGHEASIGNYSTVLLGANIAGFVRTEECVSIGAGSVIIQGINIGTNTIVGAGATVIKDLPSKCTAVGSPAKPIKFHE